MNDLLRQIKSSRFIRDVAIVATGTAGAQVINLAFFPVITRLYGPEAFGALGVFMSVAEILIPIAALTYPMAIVLPEEDSDAKNLILLSFLISLCTAVIVGASLLQFKDWIIPRFSLQSIGDLLLLLPLAMLFSVCLNVAQFWLIRKKKFKLIAKAAIAQAALINGAKVGLGWFNPYALVLIVVTVFGYAVHALQLAFGIKSNSSAASAHQTFSARKLKHVAYRYRGFPFFRASQTFLSRVSHSLPVLLLAMFFDPAAAGFYTIARTSLSLPAILIGKSISDVFYPKFTEAARAGQNTRSLLAKTNLTLAVVGLLPFSTIIIFGPWLFAFVFGPDWEYAGEYARWMALWMYFTFIIPPSVSATAVLGLQHYILINEVLGIVLRLAALSIGFYLFESDLFAVAGFSLAGVVLNITLILFVIFNSAHTNIIRK